MRLPSPSSLCLVLAAAASGLLTAACDQGKPAAGTLRIAVVPKGTMHEFWKSVHAGAMQAAAQLHVQIEWKGPDPEGDRQAQINLLENFVSSGVDGIVLAPVDENALAPAVAGCKRAGVPTVVIDSGLNGSDMVAFVATDNRQGGVLAATHLGALLGGKGKVVVLRFGQGSASTMAREAGFLETLAAQFPGVQVVSSDQYGGDTEKSHHASESLLVAHPDIDGAFCPNESTTHGMLIALQRAGRAGKTRFVGFDASAPLIAGLDKGEIDGLVLKDPVTMGRRGVELMVQHLRHQPVPATESTALLLATRDNRQTPAVKALLQPDLSILGK
jgi:ribose transport system substrate-binding protein